MSKFINILFATPSDCRWYRKLRGGYWVYWHFLNWQKVSKEQYLKAKLDRMSRPRWSLEDFTQKKTNQ